MTTSTCQNATIDPMGDSVSIQIPTISLEMPVPSQGHYGFHSFPVVDWSLVIELQKL
jgi:hypothetical protein